MESVSLAVRTAVEMLQRHGVTQDEGFLDVDPRIGVGMTLGATMPVDAASGLLAFLSAEKPLCVRAVRPDGATKV